MFFRDKPKSYYSFFSFFFKIKLFALFLFYIILILFISFCFSIFYELTYAGNENLIINIGWLEKLYFSIITFISPGFTEFLPADNFSRILVLINGIFGVSFNALFLSVLVSKIIQPHEPFEVVPFLLYDPRIKKLLIRFYSTLPYNCYNLQFKFFRFFIYKDNLDMQGKQMGATREIKIVSSYRNVLIRNYGILINAEIDFIKNHQNASIKRRHRRNKIPIEWIDPKHPKFLEGHFYLTIEAETMQGKMFQMVNYYLDKNHIKIGHHKLLNENTQLTLKTWYNWKQYDWDMWGKIGNIPNIEKYCEDLIVKEYK